MKAEFDGKRIKLTGETSDRKYHDRLIDLLVAMKLYELRERGRGARQKGPVTRLVAAGFACAGLVPALPR